MIDLKNPKNILFLINSRQEVLNKIEKICLESFQFGDKYLTQRGVIQDVVATKLGQKLGPQLMVLINHVLETRFGVKKVSHRNRCKYKGVSL